MKDDSTNCRTLYFADVQQFHHSAENDEAERRSEEKGLSRLGWR
jgi:hypothetical protein